MKQRYELLLALTETTQTLTQILSGFEQPQLNRIPFAGSWTAGQLMEHLLKSESGLPALMLGPTEPARRSEEANAPAIAGIFLDFTTKLQAPKAGIPSGSVHDKQQLLEAFQQTRQEIASVARTEDLSVLCTAYAFPTLGLFTRWEWIYFVICHSKRHIRQLQHIYDETASVH